MATFQSNHALARHRSNRVLANTAKPLASAASISGASSTTTGSVAGGPSTLQSAHATTSNVSLFLTNLRLLDLDLLPDWPGISTHTFSTRDLGQGQRKRIQCVEWALFQLFALWDPEEARNKLEPFFPPHDHVQSLNLRAALLRSLEQAKKNGVLGRDAVVRKTMLDECKGERLEEVLAVLSSAVLKKLVAEDQLNNGGHAAIAPTLALENRGYTGERTDLRTLIIAHKASLGGLLRDKHAARAKYDDFSELLDLKQQSIEQRREQAKEALAAAGASGAENMSEDSKRRLWSTVRNNWTGNERWMDALLHGDSSLQSDGVLTAPFDRVWRRVQSNRLAQLEDGSAGLLAQLDGRVKAQKTRLDQWKSFHVKMVGEQRNLGEKCAETQASRKGIDLGFSSHDGLHLGRSSPRKLPNRVSSTLGGPYLELVTGLQEELSRIDHVPATSLASILGDTGRPQRPSPMDLLSVDDTAEEEAISELSEGDEEEPQQPFHEQRAQPMPTARDAHPEPVSKPAPRSSRTVSQDFEILDMPRSPTSQRTISPRKKAPPPPSLQIQSPPASPTRSGTSSPKQSPNKQMTPPEPSAQSPDQIKSPTQQMADQILASMSNASPSPAKKSRHTLSLAERTRLSMVKGPRSATIDEDDEADFEALSIKRNTNAQSHSKSNRESKISEEGGDFQDLVARTRQSMVGLEAARQKAQVERRRSQRQSRHAPSASYSRKESSSFYPLAEEEADTSNLIAEELIMKGEDDPEAVFRSRPKIKTSPAPSPVRGCSD